MLDIEADTACNRGIPRKNFKITHNCLIFILYHHFLDHFLIISRSVELMFYSFKVFLIKIIKE